MTESFSGVAIMAYVTAEQARKLAVVNGEPPEQLHVTLGYLTQKSNEISLSTRFLLQANLRLYINAFFAPGFKSIQGQPFARAQFNYNSADPDREPCATLLVQSAGLSVLHSAVETAITATAGISASKEFPIWVPHITIAYNQPVDAVKWNLENPVIFDKIRVSWGGHLVDIF